MRYRVLTDASRWLSAEARQSDAPLIEELKPAQYSHRGRDEELPEEDVGTALDEWMAEWGDRSRPESDAVFAPRLRRLLPLLRREASDTDLWTFLNMTVGWKYVVWRWKGRKPVGVRRINGNLDRSALGRLWWMAEMANGRGDDRTDSEKSLEERVAALLRTQDMAVQLYERPGMFARPGLTPLLLRAAADGDWDEAQFRLFARNCSGYFGVRLTAPVATEVLAKSVARQVERARE